MKYFTKKNVKAATFEYVPMILGIRVPGFIRIHFRYAKRNPLIWLVLTLAPFIIGLIVLSSFAENVLKVPLKGWQNFFIVVFFIALAFFAAERSRRFRRFYVGAIPGMVVLNGLISMFFKTGFSFGSLVVFLILSALPAWVLGKLSMGKGYKMLSDGADRSYRPGRDLYMDGQYDAAFVHLEAAAKRGHMKSLYLLGHAHENANGRERDLIKAAHFYEKASSKGYHKASLAYQRVLTSLDPAQLELYEADMKTLEVNQLF